MPMGTGITIPFDGVALRDHRKLVELVEQSGYSSVWTAESGEHEGFVPLAAASQWSSSLEFGTAVVPAFTRGPALMAMSAATMASLTGGRFTLGIGSSSDVVVSQWNGIAFAEPYRRTRDTVRFLRRALAGEKISARFDTFEIEGFRLPHPPPVPPRILVAALRPQMLRMAATESDGVILNWLGADDVPRIVDAMGEKKHVMARLFVLPIERGAALEAGRRLIAGYFNVTVYREFQKWLGRGQQLSPMWDAWARGDRGAALDAVPESLVDELIIHGSLVECREKISRYLQNGVDTACLALLPGDYDLRSAISALAPAGVKERS